MKSTQIKFIIIMTYQVIVLRVFLVILAGYDSFYFHNFDRNGPPYKCGWMWKGAWPWLQGLTWVWGWPWIPPWTRCPKAQSPLFRTPGSRALPWCYLSSRCSARGNDFNEFSTPTAGRTLAGFWDPQWTTGARSVRVSIFKLQFHSCKQHIKT